MKQIDERSLYHKVWRMLRHYIGRLGSWWKACSSLVYIAHLHPEIFSSTSIRAVRSQVHTSVGVSNLRSSNYIPDTTISSSTHKESTTKLPASYLFLQRLYGTNAANEFVERLQRRQQGETYVHAELLILSHFYQNNFTFGGDVCYIGCSKPSCYCCQLYMRLQSRPLLPRPSHGQTWIRWAMPTLKVFSSEQCCWESQLMFEMLRHMQREIKYSSKLQIRTDRLESITGLSLESLQQQGCQVADPI